jgi:lipoyl(octanoyl) transferase
LTITQLGLVDYQQTLERMRAFTETREPHTPDELWVCEHPPVYTQGLNGKPEHVLTKPAHIPLLHSDRGGQVTYHGPGQVIVYCLLDTRRGIHSIRSLVRLLEQGVIDLLAQHQVQAFSRVDAPGVYVGGSKIASLGLKVRKSCTYHGIALNVDMDLSPFAAINPCGLAGMAVTQLKDLGITLSPDQAGAALARHLSHLLHEHQHPAR